MTDELRRLNWDYAVRLAEQDAALCVVGRQGRAETERADSLQVGVEVWKCVDV